MTDGFAIVAKNEILPIKDKNTGSGLTKIYVGAGWDVNEGKTADLDLVAACLVNGKLTSGTRLVYFGDKTEPGVTLGADNRSGEGDGDDENIVFELDKVESDVTEIAVGLCAYSGADLSSAKNVKFRGVSGSKATDPQIFEVPMVMAEAGDTVLHAATFKRETDGSWSVKNVNTFYKKGSGTKSIEGFRDLFLAA